MIDLPEDIKEKLRDQAKEKKQPGWMSPMLAKLTHEVFSDKNWIFERKLDGERCLIFKKGGKVKLMSRNQKELNNTYPELMEALESQEADNFIADSEIVAFDGNVTSFRKLQKRMHLKDSEEIANSKVKVYIYVFDLMYHSGYQLDELPLSERKSLLKKLLDYKDPVRFSIHRNENGEEYFREACRKNWEGLIAKKADSPYAHSRSSNWLKFKCENEQEFVIVGYSKPQGERKGFGAILIGFYENENLKYAGKVGTGFTDQMLEDLHERFQKIEVNQPRIKDDDLPTNNVHWLKPELVAEVAFTEWTSSDKLRHPRYLGLRRDKDPKEVVKET